MKSPFGSPSNHGITDIKLAKKRQNQIKTVTGSYVKLLNNWTQDASQIDALLHNLRILISTQESVQRMESRHPQPFPIFDEMFSDAYSLLTGKLYSEIEIIYHQLKHYIIGLGDVIVAMRMVEAESSSILKNESVDIFTIAGLDVIFTADHILSIQQLSSMFVLEYERKQDLVRSVISCRASSSSNCLSDADTYNKGESSNNLRMEDSPESFLLPWIPSEEIDKITAVWRDDCEDSFIDMEEGESSMDPTDYLMLL